MKKQAVSPRKTPKQSRSQVLVDSILTASARILSTAGFDKSTTNRIAELAGVSVGSLYQYFPNKEALVGALLDYHVSKHIKIMEDKISKIDNIPDEQIVDFLVSEVLDMVIRDRKLLRVISEQVFKVGRLSTVIQGRRRLVELIAGLLEKNASKLKIQDTKIAAYVIINATGGVIDALIFDDECDDEYRRKLAAETIVLIKKYLI